MVVAVYLLDWTKIDCQLNPIVRFRTKIILEKSNWVSYITVSFMFQELRV